MFFLLNRPKHGSAHNQGGGQEVPQEEHVGSANILRQSLGRRVTNVGAGFD
jgi:hypothetical protein